MDEYTFIDALTDDVITFCPSGEVIVERGVERAGAVSSLFFPGCSLINYAMPLVQAVYTTLLDGGVVEGMSVLCCGKILSYEERGEELRAAFEEDLREHLTARGVKRIICACPNCALALSEACARDERTASITIDVLPVVLADMGYTIDPAVIAKHVAAPEGNSPMLCTHDSCPDRKRGAFAEGLRRMLPEGSWVDPAHSRARSICCGSLPRAQGKIEAADACARTNGQEAKDVHADALVTACMSCTFQLNMAQDLLPAIHFLELLYDWKIDWGRVAQYMKLRFLFNEQLGVVRKDSTRRFVNLEEGSQQIEPTRSDEALEQAQANEKDLLAGHESAISNFDVVEIDE